VPKHSQKEKTSKRPSSKQVRAWLKTVIAPMVTALDVESNRAEERSWSFRGRRRRDFEFLLPSQMMVARPYLPNLEQMQRYDGTFANLAKKHDGSLDDLRRACQATYDSVLADSGFSTLIQQCSGANPEYFAEYVVNNVQNLPYDYSDNELWNKHATAFLDLRRSPALGASFDALDEAGDHFTEAVRQLRTYLRTLQQQFADRYNLPAVEADWA